MLLSSSATPTVAPDSISVSIGQSATFLCEASGSPPPSLTWFNGSTEITEGTPRTTLTSSTLTLSEIVREDQGQYICRAVYLNGSTESSATLWVNGEVVSVSSLALYIAKHFSLLPFYITHMHITISLSF